MSKKRPHRGRGRLCGKGGVPPVQDSFLPCTEHIQGGTAGGGPPDALVGGVGEGCGVNCRLLVASNAIMPYLFLCVDTAFVEDNQGRQFPSFWKGAAQCGQVERHRWPLWQGIGELKMREGRRVPTRVSCALFSNHCSRGVP